MRLNFYRRGGKSYRCNAGSKKNEPEEFDAFAAVAVAGLRAGAEADVRAAYR
jgi:hypothetical protein